MTTIFKELELELPSEKAIEKFVKELNEWWPKEYTWSQDTLEEIKIDVRKDGLCTEIGPHGFRCDWGRITELSDDTIELKWQIGPKREPVPNPDKASDLKICFVRNGSSTILKLEHYNFEKHGPGWEEYRSMMDSEKGWDYILQKFAEYCG
jgi:hypothetical protein